MDANLTTTAEIDREWWKEAVVYQIYPRSFMDSNGDGVGDIQGIIEKVDYLDSLGVDLVWLCPVYDSPNADNGYDIRDYRSIMDEFGEMDDWERLLAELHQRDIRLIMDLVLNHTARSHEWFQRSRRREDGYEDYYYWRDGEVDENGDPIPPNNWESIFGGPAWSYDEERGQWYLHLFDENQPDLNWRNLDVRAEMKDVVSWWLDRGIDGFRMDAVSHISKTDGLPDGDPEESPVGISHYSHGPRLEEYLAELAADVLAGHDITTVAEMGHTTVDQAADYLENDLGLDMIFQFGHMGVDGGWDLEDFGEWDLTDFKRIVTEKQRSLDGQGWDALFLGNHDQPRMVSRFGDTDRFRERSASLIATFLLTMRGTPYIYQGAELGMTNADFESLEDIDDPMTVGHVEEYFETGAIDTYEEVRDLVNYWSRDHARTPMQWSDDEAAGFTDADPWLAVNENYPEINVAAQREDPDSVLNQYRELIDLRHGEETLVYGAYDLLAPDDEQLFAYTRTLDDDTILVVLNWSGDPATVDCESLDTSDAEVLYANCENPPSDPNGRELRPYEAVVYRL